MKIFNHVQIKVNNLTESRKFYDELMSSLGYQVVLEIKDSVVGYGTSIHDMFEVRQFDETSPLSQCIHLAFNARTQESVDTFYHKALANGAKCNGKPGFRPAYGDGYYAAFVIDPDGHNLEAVYTALR
jgi:predicted lactoylglutathione lyase